MSSQVPYTGVPSVQDFDATPSVSSNIPMDAFGAGVANAVGHIGRAVEGAGNKSGLVLRRCSSLMSRRMLMRQSPEFTMTQAKKFAISQCLAKPLLMALIPYIEDLEKSRVEIGQNLSSHTHKDCTFNPRIKN